MQLVENHCTDKIKIVEEDWNNGNMRNLLSDDYAKSILKSVEKSSKSTLQLCEELGISPSTAYRKIQKLYSFRFIARTYAIGREGRRVGLYRIRSGGINAN